MADPQKLFNEAKKLTQPSVLGFRLKADWENATPLLEKAGTGFKVAKEYAKAREAFELAGQGHERQKSPWFAGKALEKAVDCARLAGALDDVATLTRGAATAYGEANRAQAAAEALVRGAKLLEAEPAHAQEACALFQEAVELVEDGKEGTSADVFRTAISSLVRMGRWPEAVAVLLRWALACSALRLTGALCKAYLGAVVVWLHAEDASQAWATYQDALQVEEFASSEEAFAAEDLFAAYREGAAPAVRECVAARHAFAALDNQVARLAKGLPRGDLQAAAAALNREVGGGPGDAAGEGEDDLT